MKQIAVGLCGPGRHDMPVTEYVFPPIVENPLDFNKNTADSKEFLFELFRDGPTEIVLFVTGLTPVLTAFLKAWSQIQSEADYTKQYNIAGSRLTLMHFDRDTGKYMAQVWK
jgi:hypothetical protein|tara:strand:- start:1261 stop:1596 length:336 start_codon:yes stop_codon:yes gene_type:complete